METINVSSAAFNVAPPLLHRHYKLHHFLLRVISNTQAAISLFDELFEPFLVSPNPTEPAFIIHFYASSAVPACLRPSSPRWHLHEQTPRITCYNAEHSVLYVYNNQGRFLTDCAKGTGVGCISPEAPVQDIKTMFQRILVPSIFNMLRARGIFPLHASAVHDSGKGIIIAGESGQGKTTLLLHFLSQGLQYISDDVVLFQHTAQMPHILPFPTLVKITPQTAQMFPEKEMTIRHAPANEHGKSMVNIQRLNYQITETPATPTALLVTELHSTADSRILPMPRINAAIRCMPDNTALLSAGISRQNFETLAWMINSVQCYQVCLGKRMDRLVQEIMRMMSNRIPQTPQSQKPLP